jgi:hypothetical protein
MRSNRAVSFRALSVLALAVVGVVLVAGISPGATRFLTKKKALSLFYTKAQADPRYINVDEMAANANLLDGQDSTAFLGANATAANANLLDGQDSTAFLGANATAANANTLDNLDSGAFASATIHAINEMDECDTPGIWNECVVIPITVPNGESWHVSVWNSGTALGGATDVTATFCAARRNVDTETAPSCISPFGFQTRVTIVAGKYTAFTSSGETTLGPGNWNVSLGFNPTAEVAVSDFGRTITKVLVRDASVPVPWA